MGHLSFPLNPCESKHNSLREGQTEMDLDYIPFYEQERKTCGHPKATGGRLTGKKGCFRGSPKKNCPLYQVLAARKQELKEGHVCRHPSPASALHSANNGTRCAISSSARHHPGRIPAKNVPLESNQAFRSRFQ